MRRPSLRRRLLAGALLPAGVTAVALGAGGSLLIHNVVETTHDRLLDGSVLAIADRLAVDDDNEVTVDLPPVALGMLQSQAQDSIYYSVSYDGALVTGYRDLPRADIGSMEPGVSRHWNAAMHGTAVRVAALARQIYGRPHPVLVEVAETRNARAELERRLLAALAGLEAGLLAVIGVLVWSGIGRGLAPLTQLSAQIERRAAPGAVSLRPLDTARVPQEVLAPVSAFNTLLERLDGTMTAMRRFTADASHQLRTPLAALRMHLELARRHGAATPEGKAALNEIDGAARRLEHLLTQLIALARADEAGGRAADITLDLGQVTADVVAEHVPQALARGVDVHFERPDVAVPTLGDCLSVRETIANLLDNAVHYSRAGGTVTVRVAHAAAGNRVEIEDEGPGIAPGERAKVFERFYRVPRRDGPEGSGLGLAIVRALADRLGAAVTLNDRQEGSGLRVSVLFRAASTAAIEGAAASTPDGTDPP